MTAPEKHKKYNLLYIHSDQHTPYVTGCYGDDIVQTPNLDKLASKGVKFTNAYCPSPICTPSRMSMFTGKFPYRNESWNNYHVLDSGYPTFAHSMGAAGYRPVLFGRMHSIGPDQLRGYAERYVGDHCSNFTESSDVDHGELTGTTGPNRISLLKSGKGQNAYQVHDEDVLTEVLSYIDGLADKKNSGDNSPFNLSIGLMLPHQPYVARKEDYELYEGKIPMPSVVDKYSDDLHPYYKKWRKERGIEHVTDEEIIRSKTAYYALVTAMDRMIGDIFDKLEANGLLENTLVVYSSDHGEQIGEHSLWWKQTFYEYSVKVPMILSLPGVLPEGESYEENVCSLDLNATMLDILGCPVLPDSDGRSMMSIVEGKDWDNKVFSEYCTDDGCLMRMIKKGHWKLNYYHGLPCELFNLKVDPMEQTNLAEIADYSVIKQDLIDEVLADWNPIEIEKKIAKMKEENAIISEWAYNVNPSDQFRWKLLPEMDYLEQKVF